MNTPSPCIDVCQLDSREVCAGCFRTRNEIAHWTQMSDQEKSLVLGLVAQRLAAATGTVRPAKEKRCGRCGAVFRCGPVDGKSRCWCDALPHVSPPAGDAHDCLCPNCLSAAIGHGTGAGSGATAPLTIHPKPV